MALAAWRITSAGDVIEKVELIEPLRVGAEDDVSYLSSRDARQHEKVT